MKATIVLLPLLGLTWLIGIISVNNDTTAFAWIFTILNSLQVPNEISLFLLCTFNKYVQNLFDYFIYRVYLFYFSMC